MAKRTVLGLLVVVMIVGVFGVTRMRAQQDGTRFRINVDLVQLNVAVTDNKGNYVTGLKPTDFVIAEDGITEKLATFEEGSGPSRRSGYRVLVAVMDALGGDLPQPAREQLAPCSGVVDRSGYPSEVPVERGASRLAVGRWRACGQSMIHDMSVVVGFALQARTVGR